LSFAADNIMLIRDDAATDVSRSSPAFFGRRVLDFERFIEGNLRRSVQRGELGFLEAGDQQGLPRAAPAATTKACVWAYELYARAVACRGRFKVIRSCGYGDRSRRSLSGRHKTQDLASNRCGSALLAIDSSGRLEGRTQRHERHVRDKPAAELSRRQGTAGAGIGRCHMRWPVNQPDPHRSGRGRRQIGGAASPRGFASKRQQVQKPLRS
jgi:hypothetical protein